MKRYLFVFIMIIAFFFNSQILSQVPNTVNEDISLIGRWNNNWCIAVAVNGTVSYHSTNDTLEIVDFSNPTSPVELKKMDFSSSTSEITDIFLSGNYAFVTTAWDGLHIVDITDPAGTAEVGFYAGVDITESVFVSGNYAYVSEAGSGLYIVDISTPSNPVEVGHFRNDNEVKGTFVSGNYAYVANGSAGLIILDISNPSNPVQVGSFFTGGFSFNVVVKESYAYIADGSDLYIIDVSDPSNPVDVGYLGTGGYFMDIAVSGNCAYIADGSAGLCIVDVSDFSDLNEDALFDTEGYVQRIAVNGNIVYVASRDGGLYVLQNNLITNVSNDQLNIPKEYKLLQNYPNPFNPSTTIKYQISSPSVMLNSIQHLDDEVNVSLKVYDILGREVETLVNKQQQPGVYQVQFNADNFPSGIYYYRLNAGSYNQTRKMILLK
ncbi:Alkaline phosphatase [hydrothermal vent metagenome]|uniref:Alkaline phosphatase n=1 Tax=hydrothermal vent metagenome TaxID=652676 RepID=A0A3B1DCQ9_9ZZZZ